MSKTLKEIGYTILEELTNFQITDDERITLPYLYGKIAVVRDELIAQELRIKKRLDPMFYTKCNCVPVRCEEIVCDDETGEEVKSGIIEVYADVAFLQNYLGRYTTSYVGDPDLCSPFRRLNFPFGVGSSFTKDAIGFSLVDNKILFKNLPNEIGVVTVVGITKNGTCLENACDADEKPYNIPQNLIYELEKKVVFSIRKATEVKRDIINDTKDEQ